MRTINDGGNAFPIPGLHEHWEFNGMSLRDYFAAKALQGLLADSKERGRPEDFAYSAYIYADAMLMVRKLPKDCQGPTMQVVEE